MLQYGNIWDILKAYGSFLKAESLTSNSPVLVFPLAPYFIRCMAGDSALEDLFTKENMENSDMKNLTLLRGEKQVSFVG